jgi:large conductance mechanosensitive channel
MRSVLAGFKNFIMRGNVVELAVAIVIGAAFTALINSIVTGLFTPLIAAVLGSTDLTKAGHFVVNNADFYPGLVLDGMIKFLVIAAAVYFVIVLPLNKIAERRNRGIEPEVAAIATDTLLLEEIRDLLAAQQGVPPRI